MGLSSGSKLLGKSFFHVSSRGRRPRGRRGKKSKKLKGREEK
jgi:hypothetical protein